MNTLREAVTDYLATRRALGFKLRAAGYALLRFVAFMEQRDCCNITTALTVEWAKQASCAKFQERAWAQYMGFVREFAKYRVAEDPRTEIPPYGLLPHPPKQALTRMVTEKQIQQGPNLPEPELPRVHTLRSAITDYLAMRRALGFKLRLAGAGLLDFALFMEQRGAEYITVSVALEWAQKPVSAQPATWGERLGFVREFAQHRIATDPRTEIPPWGLLPHSKRRAQPYLYTDDEIRRLLTAALNLPIFSHQGILKRQTYYCLFGLLAVTGMRIGEAVRLKLKDVDLDTGLLTIHGSKFGQSRLVPVHPSTQAALSAYRKFRDNYLNEHECNSEYFFTTYGGGPVDSADARRTFYTLSQMIGLREKRSRKGPRIHDLRHRFAVTTLLQWYRNDEDVERKLPLLSTYLGHVKVKDTYWYLTASPELMGAAVKLVEQRWEENL